MSSDDHTDVVRASQEDAVRLKRYELQMSLGALSSRGLQFVMRVSPHTVKNWQDAGGLKPNSSKGSETTFDPAEIRRFFSDGKEVKSVRIRRKKKPK
jgi:hypothetical protein